MFSEARQKTAFPCFCFVFVRHLRTELMMTESM